YVAYTADNLEALLEHYLENEDKRRTLADAARALVPRYSFERLWQDHLDLIDREWPAMLERSRRRPVLGRLDELLGRTWQLLSSHDRNDPTLVADLEAALAGEPRSAALHNALGLAVTLMQPRQEGLTPATAQQAAAHFRRAWECDPSFLVAGLNLA